MFSGTIRIDNVGMSNLKYVENIFLKHIGRKLKVSSARINR